MRGGRTWWKREKSPKSANLKLPVSEKGKDPTHLGASKRGTNGLWGGGGVRATIEKREPNEGERKQQTEGGSDGQALWRGGRES